MIDKLYYNVKGVEGNDNFNTVLLLLSKKYPNLIDGRGKKPKVRLRRVNFKNDNYKDPYAVAVDVKLNGKYYQIGWLSAFSEDDCIPDNKFVGGLLRADSKSKDGYKMVKKVTIDRLGTWTKNNIDHVMCRIILYLELPF